jgi:two-component system chemotaxis response regulator CheB
MTDAYPVIVVGASLGGLDALSRIANRLQPDFPAPIVAVLHTGSQDPRRIADRLGSRTTLRVTCAQDGERLVPGTIYLSIPSHRLTIVPPGTARLTPTAAINGATADALFLSAARAFGDRVIGVVLSGAGADGTAGMAAVHAAGGIGIVQRPDEAESNGMPISAIQGDHPDYTASIEKIAELLQTLVQEGSARVGPAALPREDLLKADTGRAQAAAVLKLPTDLDV